MATARISESLWTCLKRWRLEGVLKRAGHKWPEPRLHQPMSGAECVARILSFLDARSRPDGSMVDLDADAVEEAAGWTGKAGGLVDALIETGWIDSTPGGMFWHDYGAFNGTTIRDRLKKRSKRGHQGGHATDRNGDAQGDEVGDRPGDETGDGEGDQLGASGSESGSGYGSRSEITTTRGLAAPSEPEPERPPRGLRDKVVDALFDAAGGAREACAKAVAEAIAAGVPLHTLLARALSDPPEEGSSVFDWKRNAVEAYDDEVGPRNEQHTRKRRFDGYVNGGPRPPLRPEADRVREEADRKEASKAEAEWREWSARPENLNRTRGEWRRERAEQKTASA